MSNRPFRISDFQGRWSMERDIQDDLANGRARFDGEATFRPATDGNALRIEEVGKIRVEGSQPMSAHRAYEWKSNSDKGIDVHFDDGRFFHSVDLTREEPEAVHYCDPDQYEVAYDFKNWPEWSAQWRVRGPRKNYVMLTRYRYLGPA